MDRKYNIQEQRDNIYNALKIDLEQFGGMVDIVSQVTNKIKVQIYDHNNLMYSDIEIEVYPRLVSYRDAVHKIEIENINDKIDYYRLLSIIKTTLYSLESSI